MVLHPANLEAVGDPVIEELHVSALHVLLVLGHGHLGLLCTAKYDISLSTRPSIPSILDLDIQAISHRAEPLEQL